VSLNIFFYPAKAFFKPVVANGKTESKVLIIVLAEGVTGRNANIFLL
jgi:hypothetical protein